MQNSLLKQLVLLLNVFLWKLLLQVRHVFKEILTAVNDMHSKGFVHADIKPLNIVRSDHWMLIDLDASCRISVDTVGFKSSTCYTPPETLYADKDRNLVKVKSSRNIHEFGLNCMEITASESFDIWSLGCILFQLVSTDASPLFAAGQDDNLTDDQSLEGYFKNTLNIIFIKTIFHFFHFVF